MGSFMASKPSIGADGASEIHAFLEPEWTSFARPLPDGSSYEYVRQMGGEAGPALCLKLKRREAYATTTDDDDANAPADDDAGARVHRLSLDRALGGRVDGAAALFGRDRELQDDPGGPFGNKGGLYIESAILSGDDDNGALRAPTIATPLAGVPDKFRGHHYLKVLPPETLRKRLLGGPLPESVSLGATAAEALETALDAALRRVLARLGDPAPSPRLAAEDAAWGAGPIVGSIEAWEPPPEGREAPWTWAVRYANAGPASTSAGFNVVLSDRTDVPHLAVYIGERRGTATLLADYATCRRLPPVATGTDRSASVGPAAHRLRAPRLRSFHQRHSASAPRAPSRRGRRVRGFSRPRAEVARRRRRLLRRRRRIGRRSIAGSPARVRRYLARGLRRRDQTAPAAPGCRCQFEAPRRTRSSHAPSPRDGRGTRPPR